MSKKIALRLAAIAAAGVSVTGTANAALALAVTDAITAGQTDLIALMTALTTAGAAVWVARIIYRHFKLR